MLLVWTVPSQIARSPAAVGAALPLQLLAVLMTAVPAAPVQVRSTAQAALAVPRTMPRTSLAILSNEWLEFRRFDVAIIDVELRWDFMVSNE